jgi:hypothetical protein
MGGRGVGGLLASFAGPAVGRRRFRMRQCSPVAGLDRNRRPQSMPKRDTTMAISPAANDMARCPPVALLPSAGCRSGAS